MGLTRSLRGRVFVTLVSAVLLSTALTVAVTALLVRHRAEAQAQRTLDRQADALVSVLPPGAGAGGAVYTSAALRRGGVRRIARGRAAAILAAIPPASPRSGTVTVAGRQLLFAARAGGAGMVVLVRSARLGPGDSQPFLAGLILAGLGGALVAALVAIALARRLVRPVNELAAATARVARERSAVEVPVRGARELAQLAQTFNQMSRELAAARESQRAFLESVSHELKTPLTAIRGYAEGLQDGAVDGAVAGDVVATEAGRLERLVGDLLDLARLDRHEFSIDSAPVDLHEIATQARDRFAPSAASLGVALELRSDTPSLVRGDPGRLLQVVSNLVENALNVTPAGGTVTLQVRTGELSVRDTGPGLGPEDIPRAFERFYLHEKLGPPRGGGSGLGLAIVRQLTEVMGGSASVSATPGAGATFAVRLPPAGAGA